jgi:Tol biopolymer transport system component
MTERLKRWILIALILKLSVEGCKDNPIDGDDLIPPPLPPVRTIDTEPDWSPDGNAIAYTHLAQDSIELRNGFYQVWILDLQTMVKQRLTEGFDPEWSPDGKKIAYVKDNNIHVIDVQSKQVSQLTSWGESFSPSWSPDGGKIAFDTNFGDSLGASAIWVMNADGSNKKDISQHGTGEWRQPAWSSDGKTILHLRYLPGVFSTEIFLMDTSGNNVVRLTINNFTDRDPSWSPDGSRIAWGSYGGGADTSSGIWTMNKDGTDQTRIASEGGYPSWSPDGGQIVYYQTNTGGMTGTLWIMNSDGTNQKQLTSP